MSTPYQNGLARDLIGKVDQPQPLSNSEALRNHGQAALWSNIHCIPFGSQASARIVPFHRHGHARIESPTAADMLHPGFKSHVVQKPHNGLLGTRIQAASASSGPNVHFLEIGSFVAKAPEFNNICRLRVSA
jgi:hypothetical protein